MRNPFSGRRAVLPLALLFALLASTLTPVAPLAQNNRVSGRLTVQTWAVDQGTTAALVEDHRAPLITVRIVFPAGKWSPWMRRVHGEEAFEIQNYDTAGSLRARADRLSAGLYLGVANRQSVLHATCLKEDLPSVLHLARDILSNRDFDRRELARRQKARQIEWEASEKEPSFRGVQVAVLGLFPPDDPRRRGYEKPESLETNPERLAEARDALLRLPGRVIAFAGDLTRAEAEGILAGLLQRVTNEPPADLQPKFGSVTPPERRPKEMTVRIPRLTQVYFAYGRDSVTYSDPDYSAFMVADHVLGGHFYSRLYVALRHEGGETYGAGTRSFGDVVAGPYGLGTFTRAPNAEVAEKKLREVLRVLHEKGITEDERAAAVGYLKGRIAFSRQSPEQVLDRYLHETSLGLPAGFLDEAVERAARLPLEEINKFISRYYDPSLFSMVRVAPD